MIQLQQVSKAYTTSRGTVRALDGISLDVASGEFLAVRGASGSGKSTLLAVVGGLAQPTAGRVTVRGCELTQMSPSQRSQFRAEHIGFVFQMFHLLPYLNVVDNVLLAARSMTPEHKAYALELLDRFGLTERRWHRPAQLSAGERQRVAMARAMLNRPALLLADEPTGNLDDRNAGAVLDLLDQYHTDGGTVVLVTHHADAAARAQRTVTLEAGRFA
jgi:ABC-type lipoprotein export system ATPase subunit